MGIPESQMSEMMRGHFSHLSESRLEGLGSSSLKGDDGIH